MVTFDILCKIMNRTHKLFFDMDGVLCDFDKSYKEISGGLTIRQYARKNGETAARQLFLDAGYNFWTDLDWIEGGKEIFKVGTTLFEDIRILSSSGTTDEGYAMIVEQGKKAWIKKNMPDIDYGKIYVVRGRRFKRHYATNTSIIIDDMSDTIESWNQSGGIGILHDSDSYINTIEELKRIYQMV